MDRRRRRVPPPVHQPDLFLPRHSPQGTSLPEWASLPASARSAAASLIARLLVAHAAGAAALGNASDER
jgi:hypothetical protein